MIALRDFLQGTSETALRKILRKYSLAMRNRAEEEEEEEEMERERKREVDGVRQEKKYIIRNSVSRFSAAFAWLHVCEWLEISFVSVYFVYGPFNSQTHQRFSPSTPLRFPVHFTLTLLLRVISFLCLFGSLFFSH